MTFLPFYCFFGALFSLEQEVLELYCRGFIFIIYFFIFCFFFFFFLIWMHCQEMITLFSSLKPNMLVS